MSKFYNAAQRNIDAHLGDMCAFEDASVEQIREEVYILAFDGAQSAGATIHQAEQIAREISSNF